MNLKTSINDDPVDIVRRVAPPYNSVVSFYDPRMGWKIATNFLIITCDENKGQVILQYPEKDKTTHIPKPPKTKY